MLSVPASAATTIQDINTTDAFVIDSISLDSPSENYMTVYETLSETATGAYASPYGNDWRIVGSTGTTYYDKLVQFDNGTGTVIWTFEIKNNTGHYWTDYHFELWNVEQDIVSGQWNLTTEIDNLAILGGSSDSFGNFHFADTDEGSAPGNSDDVSMLSFVPGGAKVGQASDGLYYTYTMTGDLSLLADASGNGTFALRQVATIVPEPGSLSLIGVGLAGLLGYRRKMVKA